MARFLSERFPHLTLQDDGAPWAQFVDGVFETEDKAVAERLRSLPESEGITEDQAESKPARPARARK